MTTHAPPALPPAAAPGRCPNCTADVLGAYCHACGQRHRDLPTLRQFVGAGVGEILSFDGRFWRTLRPLLFRPGRLSAEYLAGRRAPYVPPLRLYLIVSLAYFAAFTFLEARYFFGLRLDPVDDLLPRAMLFVVPAFAGLLHLLFRDPPRPYLAHLIVALHAHAFTFLVFTAHLLLNGYVERGRNAFLTSLASGVDFLLHASLFVYYYVTLRTVYGGSRPVTVLKGVLLLLGHLAILIASATALYHFRRFVS